MSVLILLIECDACLIDRLIHGGVRIREEDAAGLEIYCYLNAPAIMYIFYSIN